MILKTPCVLFAGGKSSRMGEDKSLLPFPPYKTLTQFQLQRLEKLFEKVYISCKDKTKFDFEAHFIEDISSDDIFAPTLGFISIFQKLQCERIFVLSVDSPFITQEIIEKLFEYDSDDIDAIIAKTQQGIQPLCGIYHKSLQKSFEEMLQNDNHKLGYLLKNVKTKFIDFDNTEAFLNLNNPQEYKEALTLISL
jgi:molybdopterin-guanine dinucleotide biosynthesis protein A